MGRPLPSPRQPRIAAAHRRREHLTWWPGNEADVLWPPKAKGHALKAHVQAAVVLLNRRDQLVPAKWLLRPEVTAGNQDHRTQQRSLGDRSQRFVGMQPDDEVIVGGHRRIKLLLAGPDALDGPTAWIDHLTVVVGALPQRPRQQSLSAGNVGDGRDGVAKAFGDKVGEHLKPLRVAVQSVLLPAHTGTYPARPYVAGSFMDRCSPSFPLNHREATMKTAVLTRQTMETPSRLHYSAG
jgi:hypothetical protein